MKFVEYRPLLDNGRNVTGDCQLRTIASATNTSYQTVYDIAHTYGWREWRANTKAMLYRRRWWRLRMLRVIWTLGYTTYMWKFMPFKPGEPVYTPKRLGLLHPRTIFIGRTSGHVMTIKKNVLYDTHDSSNNTLYWAWQLREDKEDAEKVLENNLKYYRENGTLARTLR